MDIKKIIAKNWKIILVVFIAAIIRFYDLGGIPTWFFNDEAAVGYNAYSIIKTGRDEFGVFMPLFFKSFGEGKLPLYVYEHVPAVAMFGLNEFAVRFTPALLGTLTVALVYWLTLEVLFFTKIKDKKFLKTLKNWLPITSALMLAIMPWHILFSRGVFGQESLFWITLGVIFTLKALRLDQIKYWLYSFLAFDAALMTYHAAKAFVPIWIFVLILIYWQRKGFNKSIKAGALGIFLAGSIWLLMTLSPLGMTRAKDVSVFSMQSGVVLKMQEAQRELETLPLWITKSFHNPITAYGREIIKNYISNFDPIFLFFEGDPDRPRYHVPHMGGLLLITLPLLLTGLYFGVKYKIWPISLFLLIAPLSAALSFEVPSSVRAIYMTVPLAVLTAFGLIALHKLKLHKFLMYMLWLMIIFNFFYFITGYFVRFQYHKPYHSQYGYKDLVEEVNHLKGNYKQVMISRELGNPYIFFLFYNRYDPKKWHKQANDNIYKDKNFSFIHISKLDNLIFRPNCPIEDYGDKVLFVCKSSDVHTQNGHIIKIYKYLDDKLNFTFFDKK